MLNFTVSYVPVVSPDVSPHTLYSSFQCIKDLCLQLLNQSLLLPSLKLLVESGDQDLHALALEQITAAAKVWS